MCSLIDHRRRHYHSTFVLGCSQLDDSSHHPTVVQRQSGCCGSPPQQTETRHAAGEVSPGASKRGYPMNVTRSGEARGRRLAGPSRAGPGGVPGPGHVPPSAAASRPQSQSQAPTATDREYDERPLRGALSVSPRPVGVVVLVVHTCQPA